MAILFPDPFDALVQVQTGVWMPPAPAAGSAPVQAPAVAIRQSTYSERATISLSSPRCPGEYKKSDLQIQVKGNAIRIAGAKTVWNPARGGALHRRERSAGRFDRAITVPVEIDREPSQRPSAKRAYWRFIYRAPSGTSRDRSLSLEVGSTPLNAL